MQFPGVVLDRLALITTPDAPAAERRLRAMAFLGPLIALYTGRHRLNVEAQKGGLKAVSARTRIQVLVLSCKESWCPLAVADSITNVHAHL